MDWYRKKPIVIEAEQYSEARHLETGYIPEGVVKRWLQDDYHSFYEGIPYVESKEGKMTVSDGDWIIKGVEGEFYPCKSSIFEATYEPTEKLPEKAGRLRQPPKQRGG